jgi:hypothetical protein
LNSYFPIVSQRFLLEGNSVWTNASNSVVQDRSSGMRVSSSAKRSKTSSSLKSARITSEGKTPGERKMFSLRYGRKSKGDAREREREREREKEN